MPAVLEKKPKALTISQRATEAIQSASVALGLDDLKRLNAALALAAAEGVSRNPSFASHVRTLYEQMGPQKKAPTRVSKASKVEPEVELIPVKKVDQLPDPSAPPDPYFLLEFYGVEQLPLALRRYPLPRLKESVKMVQSRQPGTKPHGATREAVISYLVERVVAGD